tara:strand:+ start:896 stop:1027 length:132 start_codon:yes stop_codon:yes gene_type:complete
MVIKFFRSLMLPPPEKNPPMRNAHYLMLHIGQATGKAGYSLWR